jgi:hypothetical protein
MGMAFKYFLEPQNFENSLSDFPMWKIWIWWKFFHSNVQQCIRKGGQDIILAKKWVFGKVVYCEGVDNIKTMQKWTPIMPLSVHFNLQIFSHKRLPIKNFIPYVLAFIPILKNI